MLLLPFFADAFQQRLHFLHNQCCRLLGIACPDESHMQRLVVWKVLYVGEDVLVQAVGFAHLPFGPVAVDGMFEFAFRNAYHHFHPR